MLAPSYWCRTWRAGRSWFCACIATSRSSSLVATTCPVRPRWARSRGTLKGFDQQSRCCGRPSHTIAATDRAIVTPTTAVAARRKTPKPLLYKAGKKAGHAGDGVGRRPARAARAEKAFASSRPAPLNARAMAAGSAPAPIASEPDLRAPSFSSDTWPPTALYFRRLRQIGNRTDNGGCDCVPKSAFISVR